MKRKLIALLTLVLLLSAYDKAAAVDYYPEFGPDPFQTSLNPLYIDKEDTQINEESTVLNWFRKKSGKNKNEKASKTKNEVIKTENKDGNSEFLIFGDKTEEKSDKQDTVNNAEKPKKTMSRAQFAKELDKEEKQKEKEYKRPKSNSKLADDLDREERQKERAKEKAVEEETIHEIHSISDFLQYPFAYFTNKKVRKKMAEREVAIIDNADIELDADFMEYYPDRFEVEAIGNAKVNFKKSNTTITADKIVFNHDRNTVKATENVVLISDGAVTEGDYLRIDLNSPEGWLENPVTTTEDIKLSAKEAYIYSDKIEEYDGVAKILKDDVISFGSRSFASYLSQRELVDQSMYASKDIDSGVYKLKANTILIDAKNDHEVITVKNADLYLKNVKVAKIPSIKIVTNKEHASAETNLPEFGSIAYLGMHVGPSVVLNVPGGSTLKLAPIATYYKGKFGVGGIARFRNRSNMTEVAYGTSADELLIRGRQKLAPGLMLEYSRLTNENEWFLGYRRPKYSGQLSYSRSDYIDDLGLTFSQRYSAGAFIDDLDGKKLRGKDTEWRFRWMTQTYKPFYKFENDEGNIGINAGLAAQTSASVYTTGDVQGIARFGPVINTKLGPWNQSLMYFQSAIAGQSPFEFDRYRYGRSNFLFIESLKICKYLSVGYLASLAMNRDYRNDDLLQENRIMLGIGPDYAKVILGYDAKRHNTSVMVSMLVGTKDSDVQFKKTVIKNPDKVGKKSKTKEQKVKKKSRKQYLKQIEVVNPETETI